MCIARNQSALNPRSRSSQSQTSPKKPAEPASPKPSRQKLTWKEERELESLPERIEQLEEEQAGLHTAMADPAFFKQDGAAIAETTTRLETIAAELENALTRWEELESRA